MNEFSNSGRLNHKCQIYIIYTNDNINIQALLRLHLLIKYIALVCGVGIRMIENRDYKLLLCNIYGR